jgi:hypothetical protein
MNPSEKSPGADVYAGDTASPSVVGAADCAIHFFNIEAESEPGTFARIANVLNIANVAPNHVTLESRRNDGTMMICVELGVRLNTAQSIQRKLTQLTDVNHVDMSIPSLNDPPREPLD